MVKDLLEVVSKMWKVNCLVNEPVYIGINRVVKVKHNENTFIMYLSYYPGRKEYKYVGWDIPDIAQKKFKLVNPAPMNIGAGILTSMHNKDIKTCKIHEE